MLRPESSGIGVPPRPMLRGDRIDSRLGTEAFKPERRRQEAWLTEDMLKSAIRQAGIAVRVK